MAICMLAVTTAMAQITVKGQVLSATDGEGLIGAAVQEVGTSNGAVADANGNFSLKVKEGASLKISYVGYIPATVKAKANLVVKLQDDTKALDDVVVIGYGVQKKSDLTGAVASINGDDIKNLSTTDAASALQGKAAGLQIINSGGPGSEAEIRVRGYASNSTSAAGPLLIVDGLRVDGISYLDPSLIESIEVLKDAASAAIYGARAGNGVVLITTKSGASNKGGGAQVSYSFKATNHSLGKKADLFNAADYIDYHNYLGDITQEKLQSIGYNGQDTDWYDEVFEDSWSLQHNITIQAGNEKGHFFTSLGMVTDNGIVKGDKDQFKRFTVQLNADYNVFKWLNITTSNSFEKRSRRNLTNGYQSFLNAVTSIDPLTPAYVYNMDDMGLNMKDQWNSDPENHGFVMTPPGYTEENPIWYGTSKIIEDACANPLAMRDRMDTENTSVALRGSLAANITPFEGLTYTSRLGYRVHQGNSHSYSEPFWLSSMAHGDKYTISAATNANLYYQWENFVNFNKTFGKHNVGAMIGMSFTKHHTDNTSTSSSDGGQILDGDAAQNFRYINFLNANGKSHISASNLPTDRTELAYFGRLSYSFDNRYFFQFNFRRDAFDSSRLSGQARWGSFPSVSAGWTISNEKFFKDNVNTDIFNFLKIRASWGRNGNIDILNNYRYASTIGIGGYYQFNPAAGTGELTSGGTSDVLPNPDLQWETDEQIDLGIDARFFNNRLTFGFDWYRKTTRDFLVEVKPLPELGYSSTTLNSGKVLNTGFDIELGWRDNLGDFKYSINTNFSPLTNEVKDINSTIARITEVGISGFNNRMQPTFEKGHKVWYYRGFKYAGVDSETGKALYYKKDGSKSTSVADEDMCDVGSAIPDFTYGITINLEYKNFDFTVFGTGVSGNKIYNLMVSADRPTTNGIDTYWKDSWRQAGDNAKYPDMRSVARDWTFFSSSAALFNGSFFKFKQIQLGYTFPVELTKKALISNLRVFASLDDFFTITSYPGADPETSSLNNGSSRGYDNGNYPTTKKFVLGVNLTF